MSDDLAEIERIAGALLRSVDAAARRRILRSMARMLQTSQRARINRQQQPDGAAFVPRKERRDPQPGGYAVRFLYPRGATEPREVFMKAWVRDGDLLTGYDIETGGIRSFRWDRIARWLPVEPGQQNKSAGKLRRKGSIRRKAMFRKLATARHLRSGATDVEAWVGFSGTASAIAAIHQDGGSDKPHPRGRAFRYPRRILIGASDADRRMLLDALFDHVAANV